MYTIKEINKVNEYQKESLELIKQSIGGENDVVDKMTKEAEEMPAEVEDARYMGLQEQERENKQCYNCGKVCSDEYKMPIVESPKDFSSPARASICEQCYTHFKE